jgi:protein TonB
MPESFAAPRTIPLAIRQGSDEAQQPPADGEVGEMGEKAGPPAGLLSDFGTAAAPVVTTAQPKSFTVSRGVMAGNLVEKQDPVYPAIARAAHIQGTVILSATISRTGTIENLTVVSGSAMLAQAAIDAVRNWRYRPYLLNGSPVAVQTTVNVTFTLGG